MRQRYWLIGVLLVALGFNIAMGLGAVYQSTHAAQNIAAYLPSIGRENNPQIATTIYTLVSGDNSFISAARSPAGCTFFAYIDRDNGNLIHVVRRNADFTVSDVVLPASVNAVVEADPSDPNFIPPGPKHADVSLVFTDAMELYYTSRQPDASGGPFNVMLLRMSIPPCA